MKTEQWTTEEDSTLRTKEQGTHLTLNEHDDDDDNVFFNLKSIYNFSNNILLMY